MCLFQILLNVMFRNLKDLFFQVHRCQSFSLSQM